MIDVARIDHWAANGSGPLHRASVMAKLFFLLCVVGAAVAARDPRPLAAGYGLLIVVAAAAGLPWASIGVLSLYAAVFALLYAVSLRADLWLFAVVLLKAVTPAYAVGMLIVSTPYPRIFAFLAGFLPEMLAAGLFMTYRTFFILLDMMHNFGTAIRIRGGFTPGSLVRNGANIARSIGALLIRAVDRATRLYAVMVARGYSGSMAETSVGGISNRDWLPAGAGIAVLAAVLVWR
jgi:energy-coupling factor transporter transmembrane protein EcfT